MEVFDLLREAMKKARGYNQGGNPLPKLADGIIPCKLNANENQFGPSKKVIKAMEAALKEVYLYPFEQNSITRKAIADWLGFTPDNIAISNGSNGLICALGDIFLNPDDEVLMCSPSYLAYYSMPGRYGAKMIEIPNKNFATDVKAMLEAITDKTKLCILVNPNNPTGAIISNEDLQYFMDNVPSHVITIIDEAYIEWVDTDGYQDATKYVRENKKVVILRTFSKVFGLAGIRFGYAITIPEIQKYILEIENNYGPNRIALVAAREAIKDKDYIIMSIKNNTDGRNYITKELLALNFDVVDSYANFIYFAPKVNTKALINGLNTHGVYIRDFGDVYSRVSIGLPHQNKRFIDVLKEVLLTLNND